MHKCREDRTCTTMSIRHFASSTSSALVKSRNYSLIVEPVITECFILTLTEIFPSSFGKCAARNQSPGRGLVTLKTPVVRLGSVHVKVTAKEPGMMVSFGNRVWRGLITGGAPDLKYLYTKKKVTFQNKLWTVSNRDCHRLHSSVMQMRLEFPIKAGTKQNYKNNDCFQTLRHYSVKQVIHATR